MTLLLRTVMLTMLCVGLGQSASAQDGAVAIEHWLQAYDQAMVAKDLDRLARFYEPGVTVYEGGGVNHGWAAFRDRHLGPELKSFEGLQFAHRNVTINMLSGGMAAYVISEYSLQAKVKGQPIDATGLETLILSRVNETWKIRHVHMSSRRRLAAEQPATQPK